MRYTMLLLFSNSDHFQKGGVAVGAAEGAGGIEGAGGDAPGGLSAEQPAGQLADGVGHEGAGDGRLDVAEGAVVEHGSCRLDGRPRMGQVVGEHLVGVGPTPGLQGARAGVDHAARQLHGGGRGGEISCSHPRQVSDGPL